MHPVPLRHMRFPFMQRHSITCVAVNDHDKRWAVTGDAGEAQHCLTAYAVFAESQHKESVPVSPPQPAANHRTLY
jgi:hypothetical protein